MSPNALLRPPLVWMLTAEAALIAGLGAVTWHVWQERIAPGPAAVAAQPADPGAATTTAPLPRVQATGSPPSPLPAAPKVGPTPGIRTDADFLSRQLFELNRVEQTFEDLEWRVTKAIVDAIQSYLEGVVLPSIERSEGGRR